MADDVERLRRLYRFFNARDIDGALAELAENVAWANGMEGGHVFGHDGVRRYWTRQWTMVSPHVEALGFHTTPDGATVAEVRQSVFDLDGKPLDGQNHGLRDRTVRHVFRLSEGKVTRFDIEEPSPPAGPPRDHDTTPI